MLPVAVGAGGSTVTAKDCSALPPAFVAVTVTVALPAATAVTVTVTRRPPRPSRPQHPRTPPRIRDPLAGEVVRGGDQRAYAPSVIVAASMLPTAAGAGGSTVTANDCSALPPAFAAVTVTVALPAATAVTVTAAPSTATDATWLSETPPRT